MLVANNEQKMTLVARREARGEKATPGRCGLKPWLRSSKLWRDFNVLSQSFSPQPKECATRQHACLLWRGYGSAISPTVQPCDGSERRVGRGCD